MNIELGPHERLDDLVLDGMKVIQRDDQFWIRSSWPISVSYPTVRLWTWERGRRLSPSS